MVLAYQQEEERKKMERHSGEWWEKLSKRIGKKRTEQMQKRWKRKNRN